MHHFFIKPNQISNHIITVTGKDVFHIKNVLRMKPGDKITFSNGQNPAEYHSLITEITDEAVKCELSYIQESGHELPSRIYLYQSLAKAEKMEMIIQKAVELGVHEIIPVAAERSVVRLDEKKAGAKIKRWQAVSEAAAKQSRRQTIPLIREVLNFPQAVKAAAGTDIKLIPYELADDINKTKEIINNLSAGQSIAVFIGPEGGFSNQEIKLAAEAGIIPLTMGKRILRCETATFVILSWIMYILEA